MWLIELRINVQQIKDTMAGKSSNKIENLNNQNYQTWKFKMELLLIKEDLWETVTKKIPDPVTSEWQTKDAKARAIIGLQVADNQLHLIRKQTAANVDSSATSHMCSNKNLITALETRPEEDLTI